MTAITRTVHINAPKQQVWAALADFGNVYQLSPLIKGSHLTSDQQSGVGATRHCDFNMMGAQVEERIAEWDEGNRLAIDVYAWKNLPMMREMRAIFELTEERGGTRVTATMEYKLGMGVMGSAMDAAMMKPQNTKGWESFMAGIKHFVETGTPIDANVQLDMAVVAAA